MTAATRTIRTLPSVVQAELGTAIATLIRAKDALKQGRATDAMFQGHGRYECDAALNMAGSVAGFQSIIEASYATIKKWQVFAQERDIVVDWKAILKEEGCPAHHEVTLSDDAIAWAN